MDIVDLGTLTSIIFYIRKSKSYDLSSRLLLIICSLRLIKRIAFLLTVPFELNDSCCNIIVLIDMLLDIPISHMILVYSISLFLLTSKNEKCFSIFQFINSNISIIAIISLIISLVFAGFYYYYADFKLMAIYCYLINEYGHAYNIYYISIYSVIIIFMLISLVNIIIMFKNSKRVENQIDEEDFDDDLISQKKLDPETIKKYKRYIANIIFFICIFLFFGIIPLSIDLNSNLAPTEEEAKNPEPILFLAQILMATLDTFILIFLIINYNIWENIKEIFCCKKKDKKEPRNSFDNKELSATLSFQ